DSARPITAIRYAFTGQQVRAWGGPYRGTRLLDGSEWLPYQASSFPTPPFAEYSSGHSTFSAAGAEILRRFTRSDRFGASVTFSAGSSKVEPGAVPASALTLRWHTFSDAANQAGLSRRYGGIHFEQAGRIRQRRAPGTRDQRLHRRAGGAIPIALPQRGAHALFCRLGIRHASGDYIRDLKTVSPSPLVREGRGGGDNDHRCLASGGA